MPKIKSNAVDDLVDAVKDSAASVDDSPESVSAEIDDSDDLTSPEFVTKTELESFGNRMITSMKDLFKKQTDVHQDFMGQAPGIPSQELGQDTRGIAPVAANDLIPQAELESFMNQILTIYVHPSSNKEENPVLIPSVNGVNQPVIRGQASRIKRKFVEALARNRHTGYEQETPDQTKPHKYIMVPCMVVKDPFTVQHDPSPRGSEWLKQILCEA
jgi:hypothetical protein